MCCINALQQYTRRNTKKNTHTHIYYFAYGNRFECVHVSQIKCTFFVSNLNMRSIYFLSLSCFFFIIIKCCKCCCWCTGKPRLYLCFNYANTKTEQIQIIKKSWKIMCACVWWYIGFHGLIFTKKIKRRVEENWEGVRNRMHSAIFW